MPATLVQTIKTSYNNEEMIKGFIKGWIKEFGTLPKKESIAVIWSQNALETGSTTSMWNNNVGNVKFVPNKNPELDNGKTYMMLNNVWEIINGKKIIFQPPHPATWFLAFPSLEDGVAFHLNFLRNKRYKASWIAVDEGDPVKFAHLLKVAKYYTASESEYIKAMNFYFKKFMKDPTFEKVVENLQPQLEIDPTTNNVIISGVITKKPNMWNNIANTISKLFNKN